METGRHQGDRLCRPGTEDSGYGPETVFRIGSISKTFTTAGIMQLWEQGKLDLDDPVNDYLKDYKVLHDDPERTAGDLPAYDHAHLGYR